MDFTKSWKKWGSDDFNDAVAMDLEENEADLPLGVFCEAGGLSWDSFPEFEIDDVKEEGNEIVVTTTVYFKESLPTGCKDMNWQEDRQGKLVVRIDKKSGSAEVTPGDFQRRNLENY